MTFFDTFILEGKNKPAMSHQAVNLLYDYVTFMGRKKNHASKMLPYQHSLSQNALLNNDADGAFT